MGFPYFGQPAIFGEPFGMDSGGAAPTLAEYLAGIGALLIYDGTLTDDETKIRNLGSLGDVVDGTPGNIVVDENGMNFSASNNSQITVPNHATLQDLTSREIIIWGRAADAGESNGGNFYRWGTNVTRAAYVSSGNGLAWVVDHDGTDASTQIATPSVAERGYFFAFDASTKTPTILLANSGVVTTPTQTPVAGTGNQVAVSNLIIGNSGFNVNHWHGYMKLFAIIGRQLTTQERSNLAAFFA